MLGFTRAQFVHMNNEKYNWWQGQQSKPAQCSLHFCEYSDTELYITIAMQNKKTKISKFGEFSTSILLHITNLHF